MNVAYVTSAFPASSETFAGTDIRALRSHGADVTVYTLKPEQPNARALQEQWKMTDVPVRHLTASRVASGLAYALQHPGLAALAVWTTVRDNWRTPRHLAKGLAILPSAFAVLRQLAEDEPDVVHIFWGHFPAIVGVLARRALPGAVVTTFLGAYDLHERYRTSVTLANLADGMFTHVHANVPTIVSLGVDEEKVRAIPRGVDLGRFQLGNGAKIPQRIAAVGRMVEDKGFQNVVEAFARVRAKWPEATLHLIGDGAYRAELERMVQERGIGGVTFRGFLPHPEVFAALEKAEVFMLLSPSERLPNAVKEAMAAGCVCVVSDTPGIEELVRPGVDGFVVQDTDWDGAAEAIERTFADPALRARMSENARAHIDEAYSSVRNMGLYHRLWQRMLDAKRAGAPTPALAKRLDPPQLAA